MSQENILATKASFKTRVQTEPVYSKNVELDKFYTKESVAMDCLKVLGKIDDYDFVIEPSAGNGSFYRNIIHNNKVGLDIKPECESICLQDWLTYVIDKRYKRVLIVGNPPFGVRNQLSKAFIKHALEFEAVKTVAFILPDVFNKYTLQRHIPAEFRLKQALKLPPNSFEINGLPFNVPCTFFVFDQSNGDDLRFLPKMYQETADFVFGTADNYDFFIMGASANTVKDTPTAKNRGHYIKVRSGVDVGLVRENFKRCLWRGYSSASGGVFWLTQPEIVCQYRSQFEEGCI